MTQKLSIYEIYYTTRGKRWKQKVWKTRPASELKILMNEFEQLQRQFGKRKGVEFVVGPQGKKFRGLTK